MIKFFWVITYLIPHSIAIFRCRADQGKPKCIVMRYPLIDQCEIRRLYFAGQPDTVVRKDFHLTGLDLLTEGLVKVFGHFISDFLIRS